MDDVAGVQNQLDVLARRHFQRSAHNVVLACRVLRVKPEWVAAGIVDKVQIGVAELSVRARVAEVPGELFGHDLDRDGVGRSLIEMHARPNFRSHHHQAQKQNGGGAGPKRFQRVIPVGV